MIEFDKVIETFPTEQDRDKLVALPYRIGLYVSHSDTTGGWEAQEAEMHSLNTILRAFTEDFCKSEFVQGLLMQTIARRGEWVRWSHHLDSVPAECVAAVYDLRGVLDAKHILAFQDMMMEIAFAVAQAFRENETVEPAPMTIFERVFGKSKKAARFDHLYISVTERAVLQRIADALDYQI